MQKYAPRAPRNIAAINKPIYTTYSPGLSDAELAVPAVTPMAITNVNIPSNENSNPRLRLKSPPTDDTLRQWGHRANALFLMLNKKLS